MDSRIINGVLMSVALVFSILLALFWNRTTDAFGTARSIAVYGLSIGSGAVGSVAMLVMYPFAALHGKAMLSAFSTGLGASGLITSLLQLIQRADESTPQFSPTVYFSIIGAIIAVSTLCFILVLFHSIPRRFLTMTMYNLSESENTKSVGIQQEESVSNAKNNSNLSNGVISSSNTPDGSQIPLLSADKSETVGIYNVNFADTPQIDSVVRRSICEILTGVRLYLICQLSISLLNFAYLGFMTFPFVHYDDNTAKRMIFWSSFLNTLLGAVGRVITVFPRLHMKIVIPQCITQAFLFSFLLILCFIDVKQSETSWVWAAIAASGCYGLLFGYMDTLLKVKVIECVRSEEIESSSRYVGLAAQIGALCGSMASFGLTQTVLRN